MSKEIRQMIDKFKNFKQFINEQTEQTSNTIYHFVDEKKFVNILSKNELKRAHVKISDSFRIAE